MDRAYNPARARSFFEDVVFETPGDPHLDQCIQCGSCGGSCPSGPDMEHTPRQLFAMINAGMREEVLQSNTPWFCVSCYFCVARCPQDVHITDLMYSLKRMSVNEGYRNHSTASDAPDFSKAFVDCVEKYGRSFELGLATRYHLKHHPIGMLKQATTLGLGLLKRGRIDLTPQRIRGHADLKKILRKAHELEAAKA